MAYTFRNNSLSTYRSTVFPFLTNFIFHTGFLEADFPEDNVEFDTPDPDWIRELRGYQRELAEPGLQGHNYIICAPTGSGKTMVAAYVVYKHLRRTRYKTCYTEQLHPVLCSRLFWQTVRSYRPRT